MTARRSGPSSEHSSWSPARPAAVGEDRDLSALRIVDMRWAIATVGDRARGSRAAHSRSVSGRRAGRLVEVSTAESAAPHRDRDPIFCHGNRGRVATTVGAVGQRVAWRVDLRRARGARSSRRASALRSGGSRGLKRGRGRSPGDQADDPPSDRSLRDVGPVIRRLPVARYSSGSRRDGRAEPVSRRSRGSSGWTSIRLRADLLTARRYEATRRRRARAASNDRVESLSPLSIRSGGRCTRRRARRGPARPAPRRRLTATTGSGRRGASEAS